MQPGGLRVSYCCPPHSSSSQRPLPSSCRLPSASNPVRRPRPVSVSVVTSVAAVVVVLPASAVWLATLVFCSPTHLLRVWGERAGAGRASGAAGQLSAPSRCGSRCLSAVVVCPPPRSEVLRCVCVAPVWRRVHCSFSLLLSRRETGRCPSGAGSMGALPRPALFRLRRRPSLRAGAGLKSLVL